MSFAARTVASLLARLARCSGRRAGAALVYHRIAADPGDPARSVVPAHGARVFEAQVRHLAACYDVVPASDLVAAVRTRKRGQRFPVSVTFDDDLQSHRHVAMPVLRRHGLTGTFFVSGASLSASHAFWWERLQYAVDAQIPVANLVPEGLAAHSIGDLAMAIRDLPADERDAVAARLRARLGPDPDDAGLREEDIRALAEAGCEIGMHTLRHDYLPRLDEPALARAMNEGRDRLAEVGRRPVRTIAYPHGAADGRAAAAARAARYGVGFTTRPTAVLADDDPLLLGRLEPSFRSASRFALRLVLTLIGRGR
ncbi:MAG: polysaccharide deacetylase family protein [Solirubrobacterales bacterium]|nr:polysaccharide deacetylase family protein [Solirubrobacterales bacterium]MBV9366598.1 polysaccharide deacetylase family protein [Solirubrobacterales bacterium]MBV9685413.1 polysaccharide deacetylase family protein [Solirubrobacterales bacterium]MBV9808040.1 polysaccharide deacetylase family protein [Solirubrobacterales bacterium]